VQAPDAIEVPPNNPPPSVDEEHVGVLAVDGANCEIWVDSNQTNRVFLPFGHCVFHECFNNIVVWFGTNVGTNVQCQCKMPQ
jgi:hypothetical protein